MEGAVAYVREAWSGYGGGMGGNPRNGPKGIIKIDWIRAYVTLKQRLVLI